MKYYRIAICAAAALAAFSCSKVHESVGTGYVSFSIADNQEVAEVTKANVSDFTALPSADQFSIVITNSENTEVFKGLVTDWSTDRKLAVGDYTVTATYGDTSEEGFDKPYFVGSKAFSVIGGETTAVTVTVSLGNSIVKVVTTEMFDNYFSSYDFDVTTGSGNVIDFTPTETRGAFIDAYMFKISGTVTPASGAAKSAISAKEYRDLEAATCYTLTFDVSNVGGVKVTITFNDTVETVELGEIELNN